MQQTTVMFLALVPAVLICDSTTDITALIDRYGDDLPNPGSMRAEWLRWQRMWESESTRTKELPQTLQATLKASVL